MPAPAMGRSRGSFGAAGTSIRQLHLRQLQPACGPSLDSRFAWLGHPWPSLDRGAQTWRLPGVKTSFAGIRISVQSRWPLAHSTPSSSLQARLWLSTAHTAARLISESGNVSTHLQARRCTRTQPVERQSQTRILNAGEVQSDCSSGCFFPAAGSVYSTECRRQRRIQIPRTGPPPGAFRCSTCMVCT